MVVALCVFGANGVGKTTLLEAVVSMLPSGSILVGRGSAILMKSLGVTSYEALEGMSAAAKKRALHEGIATFVRTATSRVVIVDTHLVVPIRGSEGLVVEDMWDDYLLEHVGGFVHVTASPITVHERRRGVAERALRAQRSTPGVCAEDLQLNAMRWQEVSPRMSHTRVIANDHAIANGAREILTFIESLT